MSEFCKRCGAPTKSKRHDYCGYSCSNADKNEKRNIEFDKLPSDIVWACGGGIQSTAIAALILTGELPRPKYSVIVDTGYERRSTWDYVHSRLIPRLKDIDVDLQIIKTNDYADNALFNNGCLLIPAYGKSPDGGSIRYKTLCNGVWKVKVIRRWLRELGVQKCITWLGISQDEGRRRRHCDVKWNLNVYPLLDKKMTKDQCIYLIAQAGLPMPPRTSCYICPGMSNTEWQDMKDNYSDDWERAVLLEKRIQELKPSTYLHYTLQPLETAI